MIGRWVQQHWHMPRPLGHPVAFYLLSMEVVTAAEAVPLWGPQGLLGVKDHQHSYLGRLPCWARPFSSWSPGWSSPPIQNGPSLKNKTEDAMDVDPGKLPLCTQPLDSHQQTRGRLVMCRKGLDKPKEFSRYSALDREVGLALFPKASSSSLEISWKDTIVHQVQ